MSRHMQKKFHTFESDVTHASRLFQRRGAATQKARSPAVESRDLRMTSLLNEADRSRVLELSSAAHCRSSATGVHPKWGDDAGHSSSSSCVASTTRGA